MFDWTIYTLFVLNRASKPDFLQIMIFVYVCSTCSTVEIKTRFWDLITRNVLNGVTLSNLPYLTTLMTNLCSQQQQIFHFMFHWPIYRLFVLNTDWKRHFLQMMIFVYVCSTWIMFQLITRFETWITRNDVNGVSWFHIFYLISLITYLSSQWTPNFQNQVFNVWLVDLHTICAK
jgi:hypothetical protein